MRHTKRITIALLLALVLGLGCSKLAASASQPSHPGFPVIACDDPRYPYANHYGREFRPSGFCDARRGNGVEGIDKTRWQGWGGKTATGHGYLVVYNEAVEEYPARITATGLWATSHFAGTNEYFSAYQTVRVYVLARHAPNTAGAIDWHGPLNLVLNFQVQE
jgi:hypothetical protein